MKNILTIFTLLLTLIFFNVTLNAQNFTVQQTETDFEENTYPSIEVLLEPNVDEVRDAWIDYIKKKHQVKLKGNGLFSNKDVLRGEQVKLKAISQKEIDFYTRIIEEDGRTRVNVFGAFGYDIPISNKNYPVEFEAMENITMQFLKSYLPNYYKDWIKETEKNLVDLKKEKKDLQKEMEKNTKEIEKLTKKNAELKTMISDKETAVSQMEKKLKTKKATSSEVIKRLDTFTTKSAD